MKLSKSIKKIMNNERKPFCQWFPLVLATLEYEAQKSKFKVNLEHIEQPGLYSKVLLQKQTKSELDWLAHILNPSTGKAESGGQHV